MADANVPPPCPAGFRTREAIPRERRSRGTHVGLRGRPGRARCRPAAHHDRRKSGTKQLVPLIYGKTAEAWW